MGFLRTNDLSPVKNGEFDLDFQVRLKTVRFLGFKTENKNKLKCKIELLEVLGHWG